MRLQRLKIGDTRPVQAAIFSAEDIDFFTSVEAVSCFAETWYWTRDVPSIPFRYDQAFDYYPPSHRLCYRHLSSRIILPAGRRRTGRTSWAWSNQHSASQGFAESRSPAPEHRSILGTRRIAGAAPASLRSDQLFGSFRRSWSLFQALKQSSKKSHRMRCSTAREQLQWWPTQCIPVIWVKMCTKKLVQIGHSIFHRFDTLVS